MVKPGARDLCAKMTNKSSAKKHRRSRARPADEPDDFTETMALAMRSGLPFSLVEENETEVRSALEQRTNRTGLLCEDFDPDETIEDLIREL
jgi:hypothetical protein